MKTDNELRIAIAELLGWKRVDPFTVGRSTVDWAVWQLGDRRASLRTDTLPNYPNDLNAMAEAEGKLDVNQLSVYADELDKVCVPTHICPLTHWQAVVMATARQRAEAFVKAITPQQAA